MLFKSLTLASIGTVSTREHGQVTFMDQDDVEFGDQPDESRQGTELLSAKQGIF